MGAAGQQRPGEPGKGERVCSSPALSRAPLHWGPQGRGPCTQSNGHPGASALLLLTHQAGFPRAPAPLAACLSSPLPSLWPPGCPGFSLGITPCSLGLHFCFLVSSVTLSPFFSAPLSLALQSASTAPSLASRWEGRSEAPDVLEPRACGSAGSGCETGHSSSWQVPSHPGCGRQRPGSSRDRRVPHARPRPRPSPPPPSVAPSLCAASNGRLSALLPRKLFSRTSVIGGVPIVPGD